MEQKVDLEEYERDAWRYSQQDGLMEVLAALFLIMAAGSVAKSSLFIFSIVYIILIWGRGFEALKRRVTYPRIGYVELREDDPKRTARGMLLYVAGVLGLMAILFFVIHGGEWNRESWYRWTPAAYALAMLGGFIYAHSKSGSPRWLVVAVLTVVSGVVFSVLDFTSWKTGLALCLLSVAGVLLVSGGITLVLFLRRHPLPEGGAPDASQ